MRGGRCVVKEPPQLFQAPAPAPPRSRMLRSVFSPGRRVRINVVPLLLNVFVPWGLFILCHGITSSQMMYRSPRSLVLLLLVFLTVWLGFVAVSVHVRTHDPEPTWLSYAAVASGLMATAGSLSGYFSFCEYGARYYHLQDLKVLSNVDASFTPGSTAIDAGILNFAAGTALDTARSWHYKYLTTYCVAPILTHSLTSALTSVDFWAVGKDCCSTAASDFRCNAWDTRTGGGIRVTSEADLGYYKLAVMQAESLYGLHALNPIFVRWSSNPQLEVASWADQIFRHFFVMSIAALSVSLFTTSLAAFGFSFLGRAKSAHAMDFLDDSSWKRGRGPIDFHTRAYAY